MSRASGVNYDGSVIVGLDESTNGQWRGAFWKDGVVKLITRSGLKRGLGPRRVEGRPVRRRRELARVVEQRMALLGRGQHRSSCSGRSRATTTPSPSRSATTTASSPATAPARRQEPRRRRSGPPDCTGPISTPSWPPRGQHRRHLSVRALGDVGGRPRSSREFSLPRLRRHRLRREDSDLHRLSRAGRESDADFKRRSSAFRRV